MVVAIVRSRWCWIALASLLTLGCRNRACTAYYVTFDRALSGIDAEVIEIAGTCLAIEDAKALERIHRLLAEAPQGSFDPRAVRLKLFGPGWRQVTLVDGAGGALTRDGPRKLNQEQFSELADIMDGIACEASRDPLHASCRRLKGAN